MAEIVSISDIQDAQARISKHLPVTPLSKSLGFSEYFNTNVFFKWDNIFDTGTYKERGACNFLEKLPKDKRKSGVCTASAGNHALALSKHAARLNIKCNLVMPEGAPLAKIDATKKYGAEVELFGETFAEAYEYAQQKTKKLGATFVPGFDNLDVIAGQGTAGVEIIQQCPDVDCVVVPIGGGGLISGIGTAVKNLKPDVKVIGVKSEWAHSVQLNPNISPGQTIAEGIAIKNIGKLNEKIIDKYVDEILIVSEDQVAQAILQLLKVDRMVVEGAGAAGLAAFIEDQSSLKYKNPVFQICGSNIDMDLLARLIHRDMAAKSRLLRITIEVADSPGHLSRLTGIIADAGANILEVFHTRAYTTHPKMVEISIDLELKDIDHRKEVIKAIKSQGYEIKETG